MKHTESIPRLPLQVKRINVSFDADLYERAKGLKIDIHELFRQSLRESVQALEGLQEQEYFNPPTTEAFLDALTPPTSERLKEATKYLTGG